MSINRFKHFLGSLALAIKGKTGKGEGMEGKRREGRRGGERKREGRQGS
jgi:hypothetical protein